MHTSLHGRHARRGRFRPNLALCVNPNEDYAKSKGSRRIKKNTYYMACALLDTVLGRLAEEGKPAYEILETYKGTDLEGKE